MIDKILASKLIKIFEEETGLNYVEVSHGLENVPDEYVDWLENRLVNYFIKYGKNG